MQRSCHRQIMEDFGGSFEFYRTGGFAALCLPYRKEENLHVDDHPAAYLAIHDVVRRSDDVVETDCA
jgi:hypothetical protein